ncbi:MAG: tetratricopeptide repeat protein, partial [Burkholderiales bacterium]
ALYWPALGFEFIWDDRSYLIHSPALRDPSQWRDALFRPSTGEAVFRPLTLLTFSAQLWSGQLDPKPYHLANLLIHALNASLVVFLAWRLLGRDSSSGFRAATALLCGLLYGFHPALTEPVAWITGRFDLLMTSFLLLALVLDGARPGDSWSRAGGVGLLFLAALLSKELAVGFLLALPLVHLATAGSQGSFRLASAASVWSSHFRVYAGLSVALLAYLLIRFAVLGPHLGMGRVIARFESIGPVEQHVLVVAASLAHYVSETLWIGLDPAPNRVLPLPVEGLRGALSVALIVGVVALAGIAIRYTRSGQAPAWWILAFLAALLPVSNIIPAPTYDDELQIASRYLALPLVFACLAACTLPAFLSSRRPGALKFFWGIAGAWLIACAALVSATIPLWKDEGTVFRWAIARSGPSSWRYLYINLGAYYVGTGDLARAREAFMIAVKFRPRSAGLASIAWYNLGNVEAKLSHTAPAAEAFRAALALDPDNVYGRAALAELERSQGRAESAVTLLEEGLDRLRVAGRTDAGRGLLHFRLGLAYAELSRRDDAVNQLNLALTLVRDEHTRAAVEEALRAATGVPRGSR